MRRYLALLVVLSASFAHADSPTKVSVREALKPLNILVGSWKGTGTPEGTMEERQKGHWAETVTWEWQFKGDDAWLTVVFDKGKHFTKGELRQVEGNKLSFKVGNSAKETLEYTGELKGKLLVLERKIDGLKLIERLTFSLLHDNRIVYRTETKPEAGTLLTKKYQVGLTKEGTPFANVGPSEKDCIVTGGLGTMTVTHEGKTYYVCCSGCRDEFKANPTKYIAEWEAKRKK